MEPNATLSSLATLLSSTSTTPVSTTDKADNMMQHRELFSPPIYWLITSLYVLISLACFFGNSLVCILSYREKKMRTQFNILLLNLSLADIASGLMIYPFIWIDFTKISAKGKAAGTLCAISVGLTLFLACTLTNMFTLCAITILRYLNIVKKFRRQFILTDAFIKGYCVFTWVAGIITVIPNAWSFQYNHKERVCYRDWPKMMNGGLYSIATSLIGMVMPLVTMLIFYFLLIKHIWKKSREDAGANIAALRSRRNIAALLGGLILAYLLCWLPFYTTWVMGRAFNYFSNDTAGEYERQRYLRVGMMFALLNTALDPLIYAYRNAEYRRGFKMILGLSKKQSQRDKYISTMKLKSFSTATITSTMNVSDSTASPRLSPRK